METLTSQFVKAGIPVIPVLLPRVDSIPDDLLFLRQFNWVQFVSSINDAEAFNRLEWGITGQWPQRSEAQPKPAAKPRLTAEPKPKPAPKPESPADNLKPEKGVDYTKLRDLLKDGKWKAADYATYLVMLQTVSRQENDYIRDEDLMNFPCTDCTPLINYGSNIVTATLASASRRKSIWNVAVKRMASITKMLGRNLAIASGGE